MRNYLHFLPNIMVQFSCPGDILFKSLCGLTILIEDFYEFTQSFLAYGDIVA